MPARILPFVARRDGPLETLKHAAMIAAVFMLVMWLNNATGRKLDSLAA